MRPSIHSRRRWDRTAPLALVLLAAACRGLEHSAALELPVASKYIWRGTVLDENAVVQPLFYVDAESETETWSFGVSTNVPLDGASEDSWNFTELNPYANYGFQLGECRLIVGVANYRYPHQGLDSTAELQATLSYDLGWGTASLETWYDFIEADGAYFNLNLERGIEDVGGWQLDLVSGVGYMDGGQAQYNFGVDAAGFSDFLLQAALSRSLGERTSLTLIGAYSAVLDQDLRDVVDDEQSFWVASGISIGF